MTARLRLRVDAHGIGTAELDGRDVSAALSGVELTAHVGQLTTATLHLPMVEVELDGQVQIRLPEVTAELLVAHGWTPPDTP